MRPFVAEVQPADPRTSQLETSGNTAPETCLRPRPEAWQAKHGNMGSKTL